MSGLVNSFAMKPMLNRGWMADSLFVDFFLFGRAAPSKWLFR